MIGFFSFFFRPYFFPFFSDSKKTFWPAAISPSLPLRKIPFSVPCIKAESTAWNSTLSVICLFLLIKIIKRFFLRKIPKKRFLSLL